MANVQTDDEEITAINVTPLVDVTLVLLIVFMVTAKLIVGQGIPLDLPKAKTAGATQTVFNVSIDDKGKVLANGRPVADDGALRSQASQALKENPELRTVISASTAANHGSVMHVLDTVRDAGITRVAFAADKLSKP
ncbi:MAG TPA: biopolymer transporter ExbD [Polyangiaceae bacterium]|jgi:biopolymer transport protein ExbD|nr:biopolymer transporter ExbD [Polyangiaceae bacterium]